VVNDRLRVVFCGTPVFALPSLERLLVAPDIRVVGVLTQPDRPRGRGLQPEAPVVRRKAEQAAVPVLQPERMRATEVRAFLEHLAPDVVAVVAFGRLIPAELLSLPPLGWINLHASLLPRYRGAAPIQWAIAEGETVTGVTTMQMDAGLDTGPILLQRSVEIGPEETAPELAARLAQLGGDLLLETLRGLRNGALQPHPQDESQATLAPPLRREDGQIDWNWPARKIFNRMRAFVPWPGSYTWFRGQRIHLGGRPVEVRLPPEEPGTLVQQGERLLVACGEGSWLEIERVQVEGRRQLTAAEFLRGARLRLGERFQSAPVRTG
jgi:methionyl-tRNA formyltransferase